MDLATLLAQLLGGGEAFAPMAGPNAEDRPGYQPARPAYTMAGRQDMNAPVQTGQPGQTPQFGQTRQTAQTGIMPQQRQGSVIGDFVGELFNPGQKARNKTIEFLQSNGLDEGTATYVAGNRDLLNKFMVSRMNGGDPKDALEMENLRLDIEKKRNPGLPQDVQELDLRAQRMGLQPGTKEYADFYKNGGGGGVTVNISDQANERAAAAQQYGLDPNSPEGKAFILTGKLPREDQQELTATDKKALWAAEDEVPVVDNTLSSLRRAKELNSKTFTGATSGMRGWLGTAVPGGDYLVDGEAAKATSEFGSLMSMEAIKAMTETLKGATTDQELNRFVSILADPSTPPDIRERTIDRMIALTERQKETKLNRINSINGNTPQSNGGKVRLKWNPNTGELE